MNGAEPSAPVERPSTFSIGGDVLVHRLGYGAMQITGSGVWGPPNDPDEARRVLRRAVDLGVDLIDTADSYGPAVSEELIAEALHPYPDELVIATKAGFARTGPGEWRALGFPEYLKQQCELSLRRLRVECIDVFQLHRIDKRVPLADQLGALVELQSAGKVRHIGLSEVTVSQLDAAMQIASIASVQNLYNVANRAAEPLLDRCEQLGIGFFPWYPVHTGELTSGGHEGHGGPLGEIATRAGHTSTQLALAWLLHRSPAMLPIPGTSSVAHLEENMAAASISLSAAVVDELDALSEPGNDPERIGTTR
jgi:aryl-alcohol dehydrogenase-like predicted oxidoreductase